jgi:hypothetical protein
MSEPDSPESQPASLREILLVAGTMGALAFAYLQFWHLPRNREIAALQKQVIEAKKKLENDLSAADALSKKANADPVEQAADAQMDRVREMNSNFANIVRELSGGDTPDLFTIKSLNLAKEEKMADYSKVLFNLELEAPFLSVGQFLERLEKSDLLTEVVSVDISRVQPEMKRCTIRLSLYSYAARL